jgi:hypothetical protein
MKRLTSSLLIAAALALPVAAWADTSAAAAPSNERTIHGLIDSINGKNRLTVREDRGGLVGVTMHRGTIINPVGLQLKPGMQVDIAGHADGDSFDAGEIDALLNLREAESRTRSIRGIIVPVTPRSVPNGTFQTNGPSAAGGG